MHTLPNQVEWYITPRIFKHSDSLEQPLPMELNYFFGNNSLNASSFSDIVEIAPALFYGLYADNKPFGIIVGLPTPTADEFFCPFFYDGSSASFECSASVTFDETIVVQNQVTDDTSFGKITGKIFIPPGFQSPERLLALEFQRYSTLFDVYKEKEDYELYHLRRRNRNKVPVFFIAFFMYLGLLFFMAAWAIWLSWQYGCQSLCAGWDGESRCYVWTISMFLFSQVWIWGTGLTGWTVFCLVCGFHIAIMMCAYPTRSVIHEKADYICCFGCGRDPDLVVETKDSVDVNENGEMRAREPSLEMADLGNAENKENSEENGGIEGQEDEEADPELFFLRTKSKPKEPFTFYPNDMGSRQCSLFQSTICLSILTFIFMVIIEWTWTVEKYMVRDRLSDTWVEEYQPQEIGKTIAMMYVYPGVATALQMNVPCRLQSDWCGTHYSETFQTDADKEAQLNGAFILKYGIDMSIFTRSTYQEYNSVNDWFTRKLRNQTILVGNDTKVVYPDRPIANPTHPEIAVSPADARVVAFEVVGTDEDVWIKSERFTLAKFIGEARAPDFEGGSMMIVRLSPQDYHRFHSPVTGVISAREDFDGKLFSVNADAMTSDNLAILNKRGVLFIDTVEYGQVAFVAIGATCVGSIQFTDEATLINRSVNKGDELGYFQFGGSTVVIVFEPDSIEFDEDLLYYSESSGETLVQMGTRIGKATGFDEYQSIYSL